MIALLPDVEQIVATWLRAQPELAALVGDKVYTALPRNFENDPEFWPVVRLVRVSGTPAFSRPLRVDDAIVQFDVWGGPKKTAFTVAETIRALLADESFVGVHDDACVVGVAFGVFQFLPDTDLSPARPRYTFEVRVRVHPIP